MQSVFISPCKLDINKIPQSSLLGMKNNKLVVRKFCTLGNVLGSVDQLSTRYHHTVVSENSSMWLHSKHRCNVHDDILLGIRYNSSSPVHAVPSSEILEGFEVGCVELKRLSECDFDKCENSAWLARRAILGRIGCDVCEIKPSAKRVLVLERDLCGLELCVDAYVWGFLWRSLQTVHEDGKPVGDPRPVPQQLSVKRM